MTQLGPRGNFERRWGTGPMGPPARRPPMNGTGPAPASSQGGSASPPNGSTRSGGIHPAKAAAGSLRKGSDVLQVLERVRSHEIQGADAMRELAQEVYVGINKTTRWPFSLNKRMAAIRMRRAMRQVANAAELQARAASNARKVWTDVASGKVQGKKERGFDPTS